MVFVDGFWKSDLIGIGIRPFGSDTDGSLAVGDPRLTLPARCLVAVSEACGWHALENQT